MSMIENRTDQTHGMGTELVEPVWKPMTVAEVNQLFQYYPNTGSVTSLIWHSPRPFSSATIAVTSIGQLFVKRHHHSVRDVAGLIEEHRFMEHLRVNGISVSEVLHGLSGQSAQALGEWTYEVYPLAAGVDLYRDAVSWSPFLSNQHAFASGQALARMHLAAQTYVAPPRPIRRLVSSFSIFSSPNPLESCSSYIEGRPALKAYLKDRPWQEDITRILLPFHSRLLPWLRDLIPHWTHNDWHSSNLLWSEGSNAEVKSILDFGLSDCTNAIYDLATAIERNIIEWLAMDIRDDIVRFDHLEALLSGYESVRPLNSNESFALAMMLPLVHAEFALSEVDYFVGVTNSEANADLAYGIYFLGHAQWFNSEIGQKLLCNLEQRALLTKG